MRVFGIDCGTEVTGFGVVETFESVRESRLLCCTLGAIRLDKSKPLPERLCQVHRELAQALERWQPEVVAIEEVFYSVNAKSALKLGQVRGVALLAAAEFGVPVAEYAPLRIDAANDSGGVVRGYPSARSAIDSVPQRKRICALIKNSEPKTEH